MLRQRLGRIGRRHTEEREGLPGVPRPGQSHQGYCLLDRAGTRTYATPLASEPPTLLGEAEKNSTQNKQPETRPSPPPAHKIPNSPRLLPWMNQRNTITVRGRHPGIDVVGRGFRDTDSGTIGQHAGRGRHQDKDSLLETDLA